MSVTLFVPGSPVPQPRARISTIGGFARGYVPANHPVHAYRQAVAAAARSACAEEFPPDVPLVLSAVFTIGRPKSHVLKSGKLRKGAPVFPRNGDTDNLIKAVQDAMEGIVYRDDSQVVWYGDTGRLYGENPGTRIEVVEWQTWIRNRHLSFL